MDKHSALRIVSFGIVVETKPPGTDYVLASPLEELPVQNSGMIFEQTKDFVGDKKSISQVNFSSEHESKNYVRAKWVDISGGNRTSAPDVSATETVLLLKYADVDEYFWCTFGREPELRRLEDVLYSYSNLPSGTNAYDKSTSYYVHVSTRDKFLHIHTANNDGEATTYDLKIDTKNGNLNIKDGLGNYIEMDSVAGTIKQVAMTEIIREAPKITDKSQEHYMETTQYTGKAQTVGMQAKSIVNTADSVTNDAPMVKNTGDMVTAGSHRANPNLNAVLGG